MHKRRLRTEKVEEIVKRIVGDHYRLQYNNRHNGELAYGSSFVFYLDLEKYPFLRENMPTNFTIYYDEHEEPRSRFKIKYSGDNSLKGYEESEILEAVYHESEQYSTVLNEQQMIEVANRHLREVFTLNYITKNQDFFDAKIRHIIAYAQEDISIPKIPFEGKEGYVKASSFYRLLEDETYWEPIRQVGTHFRFTYPVPRIDKFEERVIARGNIYKMRLPMGDDPRWGGGITRRCLVVGKTANGSYLAVPIQHSEHPDPEYYLCDDEDGNALYFAKGDIERIPEMDIYDWEREIDVETYSRVMRVVNRDNIIYPSPKGLPVGIAGTAEHDKLAINLNEFERKFTLPSPTQLAKSIEFSLRKQEEFNAEAIYEQEDGDFKYTIKEEGDRIYLIFPRVTNPKVPFIAEFCQKTPTEVFSNFPAIKEEREDKVWEFRFDTNLTKAYRNSMNRCNSIFKYLIFKTIVQSQYSLNKNPGKERKVRTMEDRVEEIEKTLKGFRLRYDGDIAELIQYGAERIDLTKLVRTENVETKTKTTQPEIIVPAEAGTSGKGGDENSDEDIENADS